MANAIDVASWFIEHSKHTKTHRQIHKLTYIAHGFMLAIKNKPLFEDIIEAVESGPIIPSVWKKLKKYGHAPIEKSPSKDSVFTPDEIEILNFTYEEYGNYCGFYLSEITHTDGSFTSPWEHYYESGCKNEISNDSIKDCFRKITDEPKTEYDTSVDQNEEKFNENLDIPDDTYENNDPKKYEFDDTNEIHNDINETYDNNANKALNELLSNIASEKQNRPTTNQKQTTNVTEKKHEPPNTTNGKSILDAKNPHDIFGLKRDCGCDQIKSRYRELAKTHDSSRGRINKSGT